MIQNRRNKIVIVGAGSVGATYAYTMLQSSRIHEIVLVDLAKKLAQGHANDLNHGLYFTSPKKIHAGDYEDCKDANLVVITAGAAQKPGETRMDLIKKNTKIMRNIVKQVMQHAPENVILLVVSNPVDVLAYVALKESGLPKSRVISSGTVLDTSRLRYVLSRQCRIDSRNIHGYVIGEHGDSELVVWSKLNYGGVHVEDYCPRCNRDACNRLDRDAVEEEVRSAAYHIIDAKGATYYGVSLALKRITNAVLGDENSILTVSSLLEGEYGISDVCLSVPSVVNADGVSQIMEIKLSDHEMELLRKSATVLKENIRQVFSTA